MKKLSEKTWMAFDNQIPYQTIGIAQSLDYGKTHTGNNVFIGRQTTNNGIQGFVSELPVEDSHCITIGMVGVPTAFYQCNSFVASQNILVLRDNFADSDSYIFETVCINKQLSKYSYGKPVGLERFKRDKTVLPVNDGDDLDYEYMRDYTKEKRVVLLKKYRSYVEERISELGKYVELPPITSLEWQPFYVTKIFTKIERGKRLKRADQLPGDVPYVSSTALNNGVDGFIQASKGTRVFNDCISLANSGSVGSAFYEPFEFVASDHVTHLKTEGFNQWIYLFLAVAIEKQKCNFNFNREINDSRVKQMKIMLPVDSENKPDFKYMEQYAKNMMLKKYKQYLAFLNDKEKGARVQIP